MATEEKMTITETASDGTETTIEITAKTVTPEEAEADKGLIERVVDAIFDTDSEDEEVEVIENPDGSTTTIEYGATFTEEDAAQSVEFNVGEEIFPDPVTTGTEMLENGPMPDAQGQLESVMYGGNAGFSSMPEPGILGSEPAYEGMAEPDPAAQQQQAAADAAREAQAAADEFVDAGDYRAAAEAREAAEQSAWDAGDPSMLGVYDAQDLSHAADKQDLAQEFQAQQAEKIAEGDYEGAREAAQNAGYATRDADSTAGGADHSGQSGRDVQNLDWANYKEETAKENLQDAAYYAEAGNHQIAEDLAGRAADNQAAAAGYAEMADPNSIMQDYDPSSAVETGGSYDAALSSVDTGFDASVDAGASSFDTTMDDTL